MKTCSGCKRPLPVEAFHASTRSADGLQRQCAECQNESRRRLKAKRRAEVAANLRADHARLKHCRHCQKDLDRSEFHKNKSMGDGLQVYCKACSAEVQRQYVKRHGAAIAAKQVERQLRGSLNNEGVKTCTKCGETKPRLSFYIHRGTRDGRGTYCAECHKAATRAWNAANRDRIKARNAAYAAANPDRRKRNHRQFWLKMYGLDQDSYAAMLEAQGGVCAICQLPERVIDARSGEPRRLSVDHCHESGRVRGLLCGRCNRSIGQFADDHERLLRAAAYLREAAE